MARKVSLVKFERKRKHVLMIGVLFLLVIGALVFTSYWSVVDSQKKIIESEALRLAKVITEQAIGARSTYSKNVAEKLVREGVSVTHEYQSVAGSAPIPAQFLSLMSHEVRERNAGLYNYRLVSKWNINPANGLSDQFQEWAFSRLEEQVNAFDSKAFTPAPVWRIEEINGEKILRYLSADVALAASCVNCHNAFEQRPDILQRRKEAGIASKKFFKIGDIMGAIEADIPLGKIESLASQNSRSSLNTVVAISFFGLFLIGGISFASFNREKHAEQKAKIDSLTGLLNRTGFLDEGSYGIELCERIGTQAHLLYLDLNGFKKVNDTFGHEAGDAVLTEVGRRLRDTTRFSDFVARLGGDEFAILMVSSSALDIESTKAKLKEAVCVPIQYGQEILSVGTSIGHAVYPHHARELTKLMKLADASMYSDKKESKKQIPEA